MSQLQGTNPESAFGQVSSPKENEIAFGQLSGNRVGPDTANEVEVEDDAGEL